MWIRIHDPQTKNADPDPWIRKQKMRIRIQWPQNVHIRIQNIDIMYICILYIVYLGTSMYNGGKSASLTLLEEL